MDERVKNEYRKINSELLGIIIYLTAAMLLVKYLFFDAGLAECATEFLILIFSPIYLAVRQWMLGIDPNEGMPGKRKVKKAVVAAAVGMISFVAILYVKRGSLDPETFAASGEFLAVFLIVCIAVGWGTERISSYFADKKNKKYED